ncbi:MAG TPA: hypothetical protein VFC19_22030 [Candidatus Limnocylindrales bacterium]|nr:hypothetical protein [Candidatus Limnocylindrales bacterium]
MANDHSSHVAADLGHLRDVVTWLRDEAQSLTGDRDHLQPNVHFGHHSPCGETHLARGAALSMLDDHRTRWEEHREELASLATALDKALDHYVDIDTRDDLRKLEQ